MGDEFAFDPAGDNQDPGLIVAFEFSNQANQFAAERTGHVVHRRIVDPPDLNRPALLDCKIFHVVLRGGRVLMVLHPFGSTALAQGARAFATMRPAPKPAGAMLDESSLSPGGGTRGARARRPSRGCG